MTRPNFWNSADGSNDCQSPMGSSSCARRRASCCPSTVTARTMIWSTERPSAAAVICLNSCKNDITEDVFVTSKSAIIVEFTNVAEKSLSIRASPGGNGGGGEGPGGRWLGGTGDGANEGGTGGAGLGGAGLGGSGLGGTGGAGVGGASTGAGLGG